MSYTLPTATDLKMRYPAFDAVDDAKIDWWLAYVIGKDVDQGWGANLGPEANMAAAAHHMVKAGILSSADGGDIGGLAAAGLTVFKSGTFQAQFSDEAVKKAVGDGWESTSYGADYLAALRKEKGGPRVTAGGCIPAACGFNGFAGPLPPWVDC